MRYVDLTGHKFGRWTVLRHHPERYGGQTQWLCRCDCGTERLVVRGRLIRGTSTSCGCFRSEFHSDRMTNHGMSKHRLFPTWLGMMGRCYNPDNPAYGKYGGRGITVCERWRDVASFIGDNEHLALPGLTIDRVDNDGHYEPGNCRWATRTQQALNRSSNVPITYAGRTQTIFEWARELNMRPRTLWCRIQVLRWPIEVAMTTPVLRSNRRPR